MSGQGAVAPLTFVVVIIVVVVFGVAVILLLIVSYGSCNGSLSGERRLSSRRHRTHCHDMTRSSHSGSGERIRKRECHGDQDGG